MLTSEMNIRLGELALQHQAASSQKEKNSIFGRMELIFRASLKAFVKTYAEWAYETHDDYYQVALIALESKVDEYDPAKGTYGHWYHHIAHFSLCNNLTMLNAKRRGLPRVSLDQKYKEDSSPIRDGISCISVAPIQAMITHEEYERLLKGLKKKLTPHKWRVLNAYIKCELSSYIEAANLAGMEGTDAQKMKWVDNAMCHIRKVVKTRGYELAAGAKVE